MKRVRLALGGKENPLERWGVVALGAATGLVIFVLYLMTLAPTVLSYDYPEMFDPAMLQAEAAVLGVGHPSGYPTYMMLTHLFTYLPFGDPAYRVNLASAVYGVAAVMMVYVIGLRLSGQAVAAAAGALALGVSPLFWGQAVIAEVYTLNALFITLVVFALLLWRESGRDRYLLVSAFLMGLSLTHHLTSGLLLPAGLLFVYLVDRSKLSRPKFLLKSAGLFLAGLLPYLYLPVRAAMNAPLNEADPSNLERFLLLTTGGSYLLKLVTDRGQPQPDPPESTVVEDLAHRLTVGGDYLYGQFPALLLLAGAFGALYLVLTDRAAAVLLGVPFLGWLVHALTYGVEDYHVFLIPAYVILGFWVAVGLAALLREARTWTGRLPALPRAASILALSVLVLAIPFVGIRESYAAEDHSRSYEGRRAIESVAGNVEEGATVLHHRSPLWYMVLVEERRQDLTLIDPFKTSWIRHTDLVWPDDLDRAESADRYGTNDITGVEAAREAARKGPVYLLDEDILNQEEADASYFREAGFELVPVDEGVGLYELVPVRPGT